MSIDLQMYMYMQYILYAKPVMVSFMFWLYGSKEKCYFKDCPQKVPKDSAFPEVAWYKSALTSSMD